MVPVEVNQKWCFSATELSGSSTPARACKLHTRRRRHRGRAALQGRVRNVTESPSGLVAPLGLKARRFRLLQLSSLKRRSFHSAA
jgi:hypothetical protein